MPENQKIEAAGGDAAWLNFCAICFARRNHTDGLIRADRVPKLSDRKKPMRLATILVDNGLWHKPGHDCPRCPQPLPGFYVIHDYLDWQDSADADRKTRAAKSDGGSFGNHQRWHAGHGHADPGCRFCVASDRMTDRIGSDDRSHMRSDTDQSSDGWSESDTDRTSDPSDPGDLDLSPEIDPPPISPPVTSQDRISDRITPSPRTRRQAYDYAGDQDFLRFWAVYPVKSGKPAAYKAWLKALARGAAPDHVIKAAQAYRDSPSRDPEHTKYAQGWLNDERYNDDSGAGSSPADDDFWER